MYVYIHTYIYTFIYIDIYIYMTIYIYVTIYIHTYVCIIHKYMHTYTVDEYGDGFVQFAGGIGIRAHAYIHSYLY